MGSVEHDEIVATQTEPLPTQVDETEEGPACPHCGSHEPWGMASWCPKCGFYPALGTWTETPTDEQAESKPPEHLWELIPAWGWILGGGVLVLAALSIAGRLLTPDQSWARFYWSVTQLTVGIISFGIAHIWSYMVAIMKVPNMGVLDIIMKPGTVWSKTFSLLPKSAQRVWLGGWGISAILFALAIMGGIRFSAMFDDWGFKKQAMPNLVHAITDQAREERGGGADNLEDAINDFAGEDDGKSAAAAAAKAREDARLAEEANQPTVDCLIVGYNRAETGPMDVTELVLATVVDGRLVYVGSVSEGIEGEAREELNRRLPKLGRETPFVRSRHAARWVKPLLTCRVRYKDWSERKLLNSPVFLNMLADAK